MSDSGLALAVTKRMRDLSLSVDIRFGAGVTVLVGPSGAGKTTLLRLIAGLVRPDQGSISLDGRTLHDSTTGIDVPAAQRDISLVFQEYALFPHLSVASNVGYGLDARRIARSERRRLVQDMLERLDIGALASARPGALSGGQRQRVALARALLPRPRALLLDEPLAALDVQTRGHVRNGLRDILNTLAIPTLFVTHDYADALMFRQRIVIISDGRVIQDGSHDDLLSHPRSRFVADFTGVNMLKGTLEVHQHDLLGRITLGDGVVLYATTDEVPPGPVRVSMRPWEISLYSRSPEGSARNVLAAVVREVMPLGGRVRVTLALGDTASLPLVAEISHEAHDALQCSEGQRLFAAFKATALGVHADSA